MSKSLAFTRELVQITRGFDQRTCWVQARGGVVPGAQPTAVVTMQKLLLSASDVFSGLYETRSTDGGRSWSPLTEQPALGRWREADGIEAVLCDATPQWHEATKTLLLTGHVARYRGGKMMPWPRPRETAYAVHDPRRGGWSRPHRLKMPDARTYFSSGAGSAQRVDLPGGDVLLPIYFTPASATPRPYASAVACCAFDGRHLHVREVGESLSVPIGRGLYEPSITRHRGRFLMTLRNDDAGYVTASDDGLQYEPPRIWRFDDGSLLGNYNTQQHWVQHCEGLFLVYTRRGLNNDHVFRHRAPLMMARVDPDRLVVIRETECMLIPERGARLGNFSVIDYSTWETWVVAAEWMQNAGMREQPDICTRHGSDNTVWVAQLRWSQPNGDAAAPVSCPRPLQTGRSKRSIFSARPLAMSASTITPLARRLPSATSKAAGMFVAM